jgi:hypothetical protein
MPAPLTPSFALSLRPLLAAVFLLASCAPHPREAAPGATPVQPAVVVPQSQVLHGWPPAYDAFVRTEVRKYPGLLALAPERLSSFCPGFAAIDDKAQFYADLLWAIAGPESDWQRTDITLETELDGVVNPIDPITGRQVRSEGLLQLSYQDIDSYDAADICRFDWAADKAKATAEYARGAAYGDGTRTIHDAYRNLECGLFIVDVHLLRLYPTARFEDALRRYWIVMDPEHSGYAEVRRNLAKRQPACR